MMKRKLKQLFAALLAIMLLLSALPAAALAQDADPAEQTGPLPTEEETPPAEPSPEPTPQEQAEDGAEPSPDVTAEPSPDPSAEPSPEPSAEPSPDPTAEPSPTAAAEPSPAPVVTEAPSGEPEASPDGEGMPAAASAVQQVQALIDALPDAETITEDNRADVEAQLTAIDEAKLALTDDERALLDVTRYEAAAAALLALDGLAGADQPIALAFDDAEGGTGTADSPYQILTKEQLAAFRDYINGGNGSGEYFKLTASIDLGNESWTPIGSTAHPFQGIFDGGGYTVSGINISGGVWMGFFEHINNGTVKNLTVAGSVTGTDYVGGIVGQNNGTVENCCNTCTVTGTSAAYTGGIVGQNQGTVRNCRNTGKIIGDFSGGIIGSNSFTFIPPSESIPGKVENCYNTGTVTGSGLAGGIVGNNSGPVTNCYNTGAVSDSKAAGGITGYNYNSIENCYNTGAVSCGGTAGAIVGTNFDGTIENSYYLDTCGGAGGDTPKTAGQFWFLASALGEDWVNSVAGRPVLTSSMEAKQAGGSDAPFEIPDKEGLEAFRDYINDVDGSHGDGEYFKLTADIDLENEPWTPIGSTVNPFQGTFDGGEHTVSGLYINGSSMWAGFFGVTNGTVKNLTVAGSVTGDTYSGGIAGQNNGTVENCRNACTVSAKRYPGGVVGQNVSGTVKNCYNTGAVSGSYAGGITAENTFPGANFSSSGTVENCYNTGTVSGGSDCAGGVVGSNSYGTVKNCYNTGEVSGTAVGGIVGSSSSGTIENSYYLDTCGGAGDGTPKTAGQFWFLASALGDGWANSVEGRPVLTSSMEAKQAGGSDAPFEIPDKEGLKAFRDYINDIDGSHGSGEYFALTADIDLENEPWAPIGNNDPITFQGTFDGGGHTISGLKNDGSFSFQGLFGSVGLTGTVKNLAVSGTVTGPSSTGGIVGSNYGTVENCRNACAVSSNNKAGGIVGGNSGTVKNCYNTGAVSGSDEVGGVAGSSTNGTIENCYNTGTVSGGSYTGGIVGQHNTGTVKSCYNTGTVSGSGYVGAIIGVNGGTIENCYHLDTCGAEGDKPKTAGQFRFLASALGEGWVDSVTGRPVLLSNMEAEPAGGSGAPYEIPDLDTLEAFRDYVNANGSEGKTFLLTADIDMSSKYSADGENWTSIGSIARPFQGTFDGGGYAVSGLYINSNGAWVGFFGLMNGTVKNLTVAGTVIGNDYPCAIAGQNNGTVENCTSACTITGPSTAYSGGIVGENMGTVRNCRNTGTVTGGVSGGIVGIHSGTIENCYNTGEISGTAYAGGIEGHCFSTVGTVKNCYNTGAISGGQNAGGISGNVAYKVENCYNTGTVSGASAGGIVGGSADTIENSYYLDTCGGAGGGTPKTAGQFASGQVAYLLQKGQSAQVWGQTAGGGTPELTDSPEKKIYQIRFVTEDGTDYHTAYANPDGLAALPDAPEKEGYTFKGWATVSGGSPDFAPRTPVSADMTVYAVFQQTPQTPELRLGDLTVTVTVSGEGADPDRQWHFRVELGDKSIGGQYGDMFFTAGVAEFALKHGQSSTARDLPEGTAYAVTELEADQDGYTAACTGQSGTIVSGQQAVASFVNDMAAPDSTPAPGEPDSTDTPDNTPAPDSTDTPASPSPTPADSAPQTGDPNCPGLWLALLLLSLTGLTAAAAVRKGSAGANGRRRRK